MIPTFKRFFSCGKSESRTEDPNKSNVDTTSGPPLIKHEKRPSTLSSQAPVPALPRPRRACQIPEVITAPSDTPTKKKWRRSIREFFIADDGRFVWVKEIVPVTPTTPDCPKHEPTLPIYVAEMQALGPTKPTRCSSLSQNPGLEALDALQKLTGTGTGHRRIKSATMPCSTRMVEQGAPACQPTVPHTATNINTTSIINHLISPRNFNYSHPLPPIPEQKPPPLSSSSSDASNRSSTPASASPTTASTSSWQTEESHEPAADKTFIVESSEPPTRHESSVVALCAQDQDQDQNKEIESLPYERREQEQEAFLAELETIKEETTDFTSSPPSSTPDQQCDKTADNITTTKSHVCDRLYNDFLQRLQNRETIYSIVGSVRSASPVSRRSDRDVVCLSDGANKVNTSSSSTVDVERLVDFRTVRGR